MLPGMCLLLPDGGFCGRPGLKLNLTAIVIPPPAGAGMMWGRGWPSLPGAAPSPSCCLTPLPSPPTAPAWRCSPFASWWVGGRGRHAIREQRAGWHALLSEPGLSNSLCARPPPSCRQTLYTCLLTTLPPANFPAGSAHYKHVYCKPGASFVGSDPARVAHTSKASMPASMPASLSAMARADTRHCTPASWLPAGRLCDSQHHPVSDHEHRGERGSHAACWSLSCLAGLS
jgi:hypothetical protein